MNTIELQLSLNGVDPKLTTLVKPVSMPEKIKQIAKGICHARQCYHNSYKVMTRLNDENCKYVLGFYLVEGTLLAEHAFLKIGEEYYDPTYESVWGKLEEKYIYYSFLEFNQTELSDFIIEAYEVTGAGQLPQNFMLTKLPKYKHLIDKELYKSAIELIKKGDS